MSGSNISSFLNPNHSNCVQTQSSIPLLITMASSPCCFDQNQQNMVHTNPLDQNQSLNSPFHHVSTMPINDSLALPLDFVFIIIRYCWKVS